MVFFILFSPSPVRSDPDRLAQREFHDSVKLLATGDLEKQKCKAPADFLGVQDGKPGLRYELCQNEHMKSHAGAGNAPGSGGNFGFLDAQPII